MKKNFNKALNQFKKEFTELYKKWAAENKLQTSAICSVAIHDRVAVPKEVSNGNDFITELHINTREMKIGRKVSIDSHARTLFNDLKKSYDDGSLDD